MIEWLAPSFVYGVLKDLYFLIRGRRRRLTPELVLQYREKWRPQFEKELWTNYRNKLRRDVIVRDVSRLDSYPNLDERRKGISPWFRVALVGTYHKGALMWLRWGELIEEPNGRWRFTKSGERGDLTAALIGRVPFELIEAVEWTGDEYYHFPHIYCYFDARHNQPYEELVLCRECERDGTPPHYSEIAKYDEVRRYSKKLGIKDFG